MVQRGMEWMLRIPIEQSPGRLTVSELSMLNLGRKSHVIFPLVVKDRLYDFEASSSPVNAKLCYIHFRNQTTTFHPLVQNCRSTNFSHQKLQKPLYTSKNSQSN
jgi:hypothetical protein